MIVAMKILSLCFAVSICAVRGAEPGGGAPVSLTKEEDLVLITLKPEAEANLRLKTVSVESRSVAEESRFAGEIVLPLGTGDNISTAPLMNGNLGESLRIADLQAAAEGRIRQAEAQVAFAETKRERARKIRNMEAGSVQALEEAELDLALAAASLATARYQRTLLGSAAGGKADAGLLWVRVPVYGGELPVLNEKAPARVLGLTDGAATGFSCQPVTGPVTADSAANTVDFYYQMPADSGCRPGMRVEVRIPKRTGGSGSLVVPCAAILSDIHGGEWLYVRVREHTYARRRVQVRRWIDHAAVLASGPPVGTSVVTDGAAELFGTEFMTGR